MQPWSLSVVVLRHALGIMVSRQGLLLPWHLFWPAVCEGIELIGIIRVMKNLSRGDKLNQRGDKASLSEEPQHLGWETST